MQQKIKNLSILLIPFVLTLILSACGGGNSSKPTMPIGDIQKGKELFTSCAACHGAEGKGVPNLGKDMTTSTFIKNLSDQELLDFIKKGRPASDPANITKVDMPPKGGNLSLTDEQLFDIIAYIRSISM